MAARCSSAVRYTTAACWRCTWSIRNGLNPSRDSACASCAVIGLMKAGSMPTGHVFQCKCTGLLHLQYRARTRTASGALGQISDQALAACDDDCLELGVRAKLLEDPLDVAPHGGDRELKPVGDGLVIEALAHEAQDVVFAGRQVRLADNGFRGGPRPREEPR